MDSAANDGTAEIHHALTAGRSKGGKVLQRGTGSHSQCMLRPLGGTAVWGNEASLETSGQVSVHQLSG